MSLDAMDWVWTKSKSKGVGRLVLLALADKTLTTAGECRAYGSYRWLAERANCTQGAMVKALAALYELGELELLPEKGPNGAAAYRLPMAIGHVRPTRTNRSTQASDLKQESPDESLYSVERQVLDSVERSDGKSLYSGEHNTTTPPKTTTSVPADPSAAAATEGGGGGSEQQEAEAFLQSLPEPWTAGRKTARDLAPLLLERTVEQGWQLDAGLVAKLTANPGGIQRYASVLKARIDDLPKKHTTKTRDSPAQSLRSLPGWCESEDCNPHTRMRTEPTGPNGYPVSGPCKACHPDMIKDTAA